MASLVEANETISRVDSISRNVRSANDLLPKHMKPLIAGAVAGGISSIVTCPLEVLKTRFQSSLYKPAVQVNANGTIQVASPVVQVFSSLHQLWAKEGTTGLFRGLSANLTGIIPTRAINFAVYEGAKHELTALNGGRDSSLIHIVSAFSASCINSTITNPIWVVRTRLQLQNASSAVKYTGAIDCFGRILKNEGVRALYKGLTISYVGAFESVIHWGLYEKGRKWIRENAKTSYLDQNVLTFLFAGSAKITACLCAYPHEVIRTRLREGSGRYNGIIQSAKLIFQEEGLKGLYSGLSVHLIRVVPHAAIMYVAYEGFLRALDYHQ